MTTRAPQGPTGAPMQVFSKGGLVRRVELTNGVWTRFDPDRVDLYRLHMPVLPVGRIVYASSTNFLSLADGDAVTPAHLAVATPYPAATIVHEGYDVDLLPNGEDAVHFFFALVDAPDAAAVILAEAAA